MAGIGKSKLKNPRFWNERLLDLQKFYEHDERLQLNFLQNFFSAQKNTGNFLPLLTKIFGYF